MAEDPNLLVTNLVALSIAAASVSVLACIGLGGTARTRARRLEKWAMRRSGGGSCTCTRFTPLAAFLLAYWAFSAAVGYFVLADNMGVSTNFDTFTHSLPTDAVDAHVTCLRPA